jgi:hypothetical protein
MLSSKILKAVRIYRYNPLLDLNLGIDETREDAKQVGGKIAYRLRFLARDARCTAASINSSRTASGARHQ